jgi:hypothetical protein
VPTEDERAWDVVIRIDGGYTYYEDAVEQAEWTLVAIREFMRANETRTPPRKRDERDSNGNRWAPPKS